ncbi:MAG: sugar ABC transporter ATP-binding protein [Hoeflea sp.]|uniref:sugar ABC transporter ATP-binding protein n=1 Tax=Hoeflea sp. TaxID=1940281 RepID=UPI001E11B5E6|nr:sugar ABC transporter ATP-binding protein [Hoeflea sp.]MBU4531985.1 sugar ABC transporter ATP-binding protein [Alphaproteobacteria bacterium]MBU4546407.1 sugar ABC transporter ATP-binding protein [Alphaproteobacteria bacterium]MBU4549536.1 sugar ABC transporter ATP-binding protein [Alphaproteobacteria bacterium]MBV1722711.1 sugar ABC transporter ATP-binding protein [Hoeflea sp.]MBV1782650.1 sugar ABC transporter ATP-binding protein [Hoeflea sp.]
MPEARGKQISLELSGITKVYPGAIALNKVSLDISGGEVVGLIGENGAGKSTLMKILGGAIQPDEGRILIDGEVVSALTPSRAAGLGIAFVHQELNPFSNLDVTANVLLGREIRKGILGFVDRVAMERKVQPILDLLGTRFGPKDPVSDLSLADQQLLEIARALSINVRLLILDEPTSSLTISETRRLLEVIAKLRTDGVAVLFITHRLTEIVEVADRVVALRDGRNAGELDRGQICKDRMVRMMIGRDVGKFYEKADHVPGRPVLRVKGLRTRAYPHQAVELCLHSGEISCLAGLVGAGRTELARAIFGIDPVEGGEIEMDDKVLRGNSVPEAIAAGICLVPEDRKAEGLFLDFAILENIAMPSHAALSRRGFVDVGAETRLADDSRTKLRIKASSLDRAVAELSGGNQQKVVLAKWLAMNPKLIILDEPTRGIDVGAKAEVYHLMQQLAGQGVALLVISSDMEEVIGISDRVAVMCRGRISGILNRAELTEESILRLAVE